MLLDIAVGNVKQTVIHKFTVYSRNVLHNRINNTFTILVLFVFEFDSRCGFKSTIFLFKKLTRVSCWPTCSVSVDEIDIQYAFIYSYDLKCEANTNARPDENNCSHTFPFEQFNEQFYKYRESKQGLLEYVVDL